MHTDAPLQERAEYSDFKGCQYAPSAMAPNACAPSGPLTEHNLPPEPTESAAASERYAARHPTETAISGQAPSVARP